MCGPHSLLASLRWGSRLLTVQGLYALTVYNLKERSSYSFISNLENFDVLTWVSCSLPGPVTVSRGVVLNLTHAH